ncbi:MAG: acyl-[acyl-carrier-protein] thioesterase [Marinifilaceae bacterium]
MKINNLAQNYFEEEFRIGSFEIDLHGNAKLSALCNFLQEIAGNHASSMESGMQNLFDQNLAWVLSRLQLKIYNSPRWNDKIRIRTWPVGIEGVFAIRDFQIFNTDNAIIAEASSAWLVINLLNRRPVRPHSIVEKMNYQGNHRIFSESIKKIPPVNVLDPVDQLTVRFSDLDLNQHVNNVKYIKWLADSCPPEVLMHQRISEVEINFLHESKLGEELAIFRHALSTSSFHCCVKNNDKKTDNCRAIIKWAEK